MRSCNYTEWQLDLKANCPGGLTIMMTFPRSAGGRWRANGSQKGETEELIFPSL